MMCQINKSMEVFKAETRDPKDVDSIPCFKCKNDEKKRKLCERCRGTGLVDTQHEAFMLNLINYYIEKKLPDEIYKPKKK